ncbi:diacylglycerol/lipid kinase family protein [Flavobacterium sp. '19STA2R22 D10 B1']|uniref:diacylglycerol/lipid kinase family protein n=1 Tax=Flavobacterium aerium TaxID=3037261 RepID=UPI00278C3FF4|nr:YegS/Rv2252/BmrU family lipid kinase [Flavobacterium sp. '19STA2R22 D10 B1']
MQKNCIMIVNPISGDLDKEEFIEATKQFAQKEKTHLVVYETTGKEDEKKIKQLYAEHLPERVIVAGGDGTIKMVVEALEEEDVIIGVLPAGSANGLSVDLGLPEDLEENLEIAFNGDYIEIDVVSINGIKSLHLSDIGVNAELIKNYENSTIRGKLGYALQAFNTLSDLGDPFHAKIEANKKTIETEARMIVIANAQKYGTGVVINPYGNINDGKFEIVILKNLDLLVIGRILSGNMPIDDDNVVILSTDKATITTDDPISFQIDGEYCGAIQHLDVAILHKQMKVAVPSAVE